MSDAETHQTDTGRAAKPEALAQLRRLVTFLEKYAAEHPEFAEALEAALPSAPKAPRAKSPAKPRAAKPKLTLDPVSFAAQQGLPAFEAHLAAAPDEEVRAHAKYLKLRVTKKDDTDAVRAKVMTALRREFDRGGVFARSG